jgi:hypothetical protein
VNCIEDTYEKEIVDFAEIRKTQNVKMFGIAKSLDALLATFLF